MSDTRTDPKAPRKTPPQWQQEHKDIVKQCRRELHAIFDQRAGRIARVQAQMRVVLGPRARDTVRQLDRLMDIDDPQERLSRFQEIAESVARAIHDTEMKQD